MARKSAAFESIWFQFDSSLGKAMESVFEDGIAYTNRIDYTGIDEKKWVSHRYTLVHSYAKSTLFPNLQKAIEKNINLKVLKIVDVRSFSGIFAVDIGLDNCEDVLDILARQTGTHTGYPPTLEEGAAELAETHKLVNEKNSTLTSNVFGKNKRPIAVTMYMDVDMAFLLLDNVPKHMNLEPLTARELTAVYLHEVGHLVTMLEQSGNMFQIFDLQKQHLASIGRSTKTENADLPKMVSIYTNKLRPYLVDKVKKRKLNKKVLEAADAVRSASEYVMHTDTSDWIYGTFEFITSILTSLWFVVILAANRIVLLFGLYEIGYALYYFLADKPGESGKSTEQSLSSSVYYHAERMADEFCVRHGYGSDLASGLQKLTQWGREVLSVTWTTGASVSSGSLRDSWIFSLYLKGYSALLRFFRLDIGSIGDDFSFGLNSYEGDVERLERLLQDQKAIFKQTMPSDMAGHYLAEMEKIKKSIELIKKPWAIRASDAIWKYLNDIPMIVKRILQLDDMEEMEQHLKRIRGLIDNELYAISAHFRYLAR